MYWILFISCLFFANGDAESNAGLMSSDPKDLERFFNTLFYFGEGAKNSHLYFTGDMDGVPDELSGKVKVELMNDISVKDNFKVSHLDSKTKLCTMELAINGVLSVNGINNGLGFKLDSCRLLVQFRVTNDTEVKIEPETVLMYGCDVHTSDGSSTPWGPQVTQGVSNLLKNKADEYLSGQYNTTYFSDAYFKPDTVTLENFQDVLETVLISL